MRGADRIRPVAALWFLNNYNVKVSKVLLVWSTYCLTAEQPYRRPHGEFWVRARNTCRLLSDRKRPFCATAKLAIRAT